MSWLVKKPKLIILSTTPEDLARESEIDLSIFDADDLDVLQRAFDCIDVDDLFDDED